MSSMNDRRPGDWDCPECNDHQFARNSHCRKCGAVKPGGQSEGEAPQQQPPRRRFQEFKRGDWSCMVCGDHQYARNTQCRRCGSPKDAGNLTREELHQIWTEFMSQQPKKYCNQCRGELADSNSNSNNNNNIDNNNVDSDE